MDSNNPDDEDTDAETVFRFLEDRCDRSDKEQAATFRLTPSSEMILADSRVPLAELEVSGEPRSVAVHVRHLVRALQLGLRDLHFNDSRGTLVFRDERRSYVVTCPTPAETSCKAVATIAPPVRWVPAGLRLPGCTVCDLAQLLPFGRVLLLQVSPVQLCWPPHSAQQAR